MTTTCLPFPGMLCSGNSSKVSPQITIATRASWKVSSESDFNEYGGSLHHRCRHLLPVMSLMNIRELFVGS